MATKEKKQLSTAEKKAKALEKIEKLKAELRKVELEELSEKLAQFRIPELFKKIKEEVGKDTLDTAILAAIGTAAGMKDFVVGVRKATKSSSGGLGRKNYTQEFKASAVQMVKDGKKKAEVYKSLGISAGTLAKWIKESGS